MAPMGSKQREHESMQDVCTAEPVTPLNPSNEEEQAPQEEETAWKRFLTEMEQVVPWDTLLSVLKPLYPQVGPQGGRPPYPLEVMLRVRFLQVWNSRRDKRIKNDLLDIIPFREFSKIDELAKGKTPDSTTILRFRHFLEQHDLAQQIFETVMEQMETAGLLMCKGTFVDAMTIQFPSSTKSKERKRGTT